MAQIDAERIFAYGGVVDLRKGADGLRALVGTTEPDVLYLFFEPLAGTFEVPFGGRDGRVVWHAPAAPQPVRMAGESGRQGTTYDRRAGVASGGRGSAQAAAKNAFGETLKACRLLYPVSTYAGGTGRAEDAEHRAARGAGLREAPLEALKRKLFGQSRGERISAAQLQLALAELDREETE